MMYKDVSQWFALFALLFGIGLSGCGTEIGNGWNEGDDKVESNESRKDAAAPNTADDASMDDGGSDGAGDDFDEEDNVSVGGSDGESAPQLSEDVAFGSDILVIPCGSPFGDSLAEETYAFVVDGETHQVAQWDEDGWDLSKDDADPSRRVTPGEDDDVTSEQYIGAKIAPLDFSYSCLSRDSEEVTVDAQALRQTTVTLILNDENYELTWTINNANDTLQSVTVIPDDADAVEFTVEVLSE